MRKRDVLVEWIQISLEATKRRAAKDYRDSYGCGCRWVMNHFQQRRNYLLVGVQGVSVKVA